MKPSLSQFIWAAVREALPRRKNLPEKLAHSIIARRRGRIIRDRKLAFGFESSLLSIEHRDGTNEILLCGRPHPEAQRRARIEGAGCTFAVPSLYLYLRTRARACMHASHTCVQA